MGVNIPLAQYSLKRLIHTTLFSPMARASARRGPAKAYLHEQAASTEAHSSLEALQTTVKAVQLGLAATLVVVGLARVKYAAWGERTPMSHTYLGDLTYLCRVAYWRTVRRMLVITIRSWGSWR